MYLTIRNQFKYVTLHSWLRWARKTLLVNKTSSPQALLFNKVTVLELTFLASACADPQKIMLRSKELNTTKRCLALGQSS
jgi:hypothetical protein